MGRTRQPNMLGGFEDSFYPKLFEVWVFLAAMGVSKFDFELKTMSFGKFKFQFFKVRSSENLGSTQN